MRLRIDGRELPGRSGTTDAPHTNVHVGVQRRGKPHELLDVQPGDAPSVSWTLECATKAIDGGIDVTGPYVQGGPGGRFVYLSWGDVTDDGTFAMFRRAKLMFEDVAPAVLKKAATSGQLVARLKLTDACGLPLCARVRAPFIEWSA